MGKPGGVRGKQARRIEKGDWVQRPQVSVGNKGLGRGWVPQRSLYVGHQG